MLTCIGKFRVVLVFLHLTRLLPLSCSGQVLLISVRLLPVTSMAAELSCVLTGILSRVDRDPSRLAPELLGSVPVKTLRALRHAHSAAHPLGMPAGSMEQPDQPSTEAAAGQAAKDELLFVEERAGDPRAASVWAGDGDDAASGSDDDLADAQIRPSSDDAADSDQGQDSA